jgi:two-component system phosphate regulon sensor histidine kinase PhoR
MDMAGKAAGTDGDGSFAGDSRAGATLEARTAARVAAVGMMTAAAAGVVAREAGSIAWAAVTAVAVAGVGGWLVAGWSVEPVRRLLAWAAQEDVGYLRFLTGDEWQALARLLFIRRRDAAARAGAAEAALARQNAVFLAMADGAVIVDADGRVVLANAAAAEMFGDPERMAAGRTVLEATTSVPLDDAVRRALATGRSQSRDLDVHILPARKLRAVVSVSGTGEHRAAVVVLHDLTEAARLDAMRRDFVANVSHELRTPVAGILMNAENLLDGALEDPGAARSALRHIIGSAERLAAMVEDLLSLARAETRTDATRLPVAVGLVARAVVADLGGMIAAKGVEVSVEMPDDAIVSGDAESVRQILRNLAENAVKYTEAGGAVEIAAAVEDTRVCVSVADSGIGIPFHHQDRIFERFYRVSSDRSREAGGTGLGLSIVRHLTESMGGSVSLKSEPGRGSTFTVCLPRHD